MFSQAKTTVANNGIEKYRARRTPEVRAVNQQAGKILADLAEQLVPVKTGALKGSIKMDPVSEDERTVSAGGDGVDYAGYVEHGTDDQEAQPYFRPATQETRRWMSAEYKKLK